MHRPSVSEARWKRAPAPAAFGTPASRPSVTPAREGRKQREHITLSEGPVRGRVGTVHEQDAIEVRGDAQLLDQLAWRHTIRYVDESRTIAAAGGQVRRKRREESDLDPHLNPR